MLEKVDANGILEALQKSVDFALTNLEYSYSPHTGDENKFITLKPDSCNISLLGSVVNSMEISNGGLISLSQNMNSSMRIVFGIEKNVIVKGSCSSDEVSLLSHKTLFSDIKRLLLTSYPFLTQMYIGAERKNNYKYCFAPKKCVTHVQQKPNISEVDDDFISYLEKISDEIYHFNNVLSCKILFARTCNIEFFVDTQSSIVQFKPIVQIIIEIEYLNENNQNVIVESYGYFTEIPSYEEVNQLKDKVICEFNLNNKFYPLKSGTYPVLLKPSASDVFFHEALAAHLLSASYIISDVSTIFKGRIGELIPSLKGIDIIMDPNMEGGFGSYDYDHEGVEAQKVYLVEDGVILNYLTDRASACRLDQIDLDDKLIAQIVDVLTNDPSLLEKYVDKKHLLRRFSSLSDRIKYLLKKHVLGNLIQNIEVNQSLNWRNDYSLLTRMSNGHSRVQDWAVEGDDGELHSVMSEPRMSNLVVENSKNISNEDLVEQIIQIAKDKGFDFYIEIEASDGEVDPSTGLFVIQPFNVYKVFFDGRKEPVNPGTFSMNLEDFLANIYALGSKTEKNKGFCGADSGFVPVGSCTPEMIVVNLPYQEAASAEIVSDELTEFLNHK